VYLLFPDTTVLINFTIIGRVDLLEKLANGNGRWCLSVSQECARSARIDGLEALNGVRDFLGDPLEPTPAELLDTRVLRDRMAAPGDRPTKHLGEAETITIVTSRLLQSRAIFVSDDTDALVHAAARRIKVADTWDLLELAERVGKIAADEHVQYVAALRAGHRHRARRRL
jgi:predicted nucleic acid-binding protein